MLRETTTLKETAATIVYEGSVSAESLSSGFSIDQLLSFIGRYYSLNTSSFFEDLKGIFFFADNGSMPIAALSPLFIIGILSLLVIFGRRVRITTSDSYILLFCICVVFGVFLAYVRSFHGLHTSEGIAPDIRYLAPLYIPVGLMGIITMKYWEYSPIDRRIWKNSVIAVLLGSPLLLIGMLLIQPFGGGFFL